MFDTGPLSHFARAGWLGLLKAIAGEHTAFIPDVVHRELSDGVHEHPHLGSVLAASWLQVRPVQSSVEVAAFAKYSRRLVAKGSSRNLGECAVLALAEVSGCTAILDDKAPRRAAKDHGVAHRGTVALLVDGVRDHGLPLDLAAMVADDLLATDYRLPFKAGEFKQWVLDHRLIER